MYMYVYIYIYDFLVFIPAVRKDGGHTGVEEWRKMNEWKLEVSYCPGLTAR